MDIKAATSIMEFVAALTNCFCGIIPALIALASTVAAFRAVRETRRNTQAQIASALLDTYASADILKDTNRLKKWTMSEWALGKFIERRDNQSDEAWEVDQSRRRLAHYFQKAAILVDNDLIDRKLLKQVISRKQVEFATTYVAPLEGAVAKVTGNPDPYWAFNVLSGLHGLKWIGPPVPPSVPEPKGE